MDYIELHCQLSPVEPWAEILIAELSALGFESFSEEEDGFRAYIGACSYRSKPVTELFERYRQQGPEKLSVEVSRMGGKNWNAVWESNFEPVRVGNHCLIRAPFHESDPDVAHEIIIEPKMSFGTGHHETTVLMIQFMLDMEFAGKSVLDMGCGTGVLAILAAQRGAGQVTAIDNYLYAYENTLENAKRNEAGHIEVLHGDAALLKERQNDYYDVILANITRNVLLEDMPAYHQVLQSGGELIMSGFMAFDKDVIFAAAEKQGLQFSGDRYRGDWVAVKFRKPY